MHSGDNWVVIWRREEQQEQRRFFLFIPLILREQGANLYLKKKKVMKMSRTNDYFR